MSRPRSLFPLRFFVHEHGTNRIAAGPFTTQRKALVEAGRIGGFVASHRTSATAVTK